MENKIKQLELMGYEVIVNHIKGYITVNLKTNSGYSLSVFIDDLEKEGMVERVVRVLNRKIIKNL